MRSDQRTQRKPMKMRDVEDGGMSRTASGPASGPKKKAPPRTSAPGKVAVVLAPARHISSSLKPAHPEHVTEAAPRPPPTRPDCPPCRELRAPRRSYSARPWDAP